MINILIFKQKNKFENPSVAICGLSTSKLNIAMSSSIPVWESEGLSESDDYEKNSTTSAWKIFKISLEDWEESLNSKVHTTIIEDRKEKKQPEWSLESTSEEVIDEEIQHVRDKVDKLEKKLKK